MAEAFLERPVAEIRADKTITSRYLAHGLMTQEQLLKSLDRMAAKTGLTVDLLQFLRFARESRDLQALDESVRPDVAYARDGSAWWLELENSPKSDERIKQKLALLIRHASQGFNRLEVEWAIRGSQAVADRYLRCLEAVQEEALLDGIRRDELARVVCSFRSVASYPGFR